jgi:hypothetical protein
MFACHVQLIARVKDLSYAQIRYTFFGGKEAA